MEDTKPKIAQGFDRDIDYKTMKNKLIETYKGELIKLNKDLKPATRKIIVNKLIYLLIAMIQLRNGARISEACTAMREFIKDKNFEDKVVVKIAKSESIKTKKTGEKYKTKIRYRKIMFPSTWINMNKFKKKLKLIDRYILYIKEERLKKRVLDFLLKNFNCNTHSLRYAFINYMLYDQKKEMAAVAKFVGHSNINQLVTYTQLKNTDQIFDLDI
jgi:integrase